MAGGCLWCGGTQEPGPEDRLGWDPVPGAARDSRTLLGQAESL